MSADRITSCPKCEYLLQEDIKKIQKEISLSYGKISHEEYNNLMEKQKSLIKLEGESIFRECHEIGIYKGKFIVRYSGECIECGFRYDYKIEKNVEIK